MVARPGCGSEPWFPLQMMSHLLMWEGEDSYNRDDDLYANTSLNHLSLNQHHLPVGVKVLQCWNIFEPGEKKTIGNWKVLFQLKKILEAITTNSLNSKWNHTQSFLMIDKHIRIFCRLNSLNEERKDKVNGVPNRLDDGNTCLSVTLLTAEEMKVNV